MAKKKTWVRKIRQACKEAGTYRPYFDITINTLGDILEMRDRAMEQYIATGGNPVVIHTNKAKEKNLVKNPALVAVDDLNKTALAYWRDLGLTPAGLRRINDDLMKPQKTSALIQALASLGDTDDEDESPEL